MAGLLLLGSAGVKLGVKIFTSSTKVALTMADAVVTAAETAEATAAAAEGIQAGVSGGRKAVLIGNRLLTAGTFCGILGMPFSLAETIALEIARGDFKNVPSLETFGEHLISKIEWTGIEKTTLKGARLDDAFLLDFKIE